MATDVLTELAQYLKALEANGVRATDDPRNINPPTLLMRPPILHYRFGRGCVGVDWTARLYLVNAGVAEALKSAMPILDDIQTALGGLIVQATPADFELPDGGGPTPGYVLTWSTHI